MYCFYVAMKQLNRSEVVLLIASITATGLLAPRGFGQAVAVAQIDGVVADASGAIVTNAHVRAVQEDKHLTRTADSDSQGRYSLTNLPVGPYRLEVKADGFKTYVQSGITLQVGSNVQMNVTLEVGSISENVEVTASARLVETKDTSVSQVIDQRRIVDLPLNGRQATQLVLISGAAAQAPAGDMAGTKNFYSSPTISVAGGQANGTNYLLDGGDNNDTFSNVSLPFPFPDALQEFSVETSTLPARNGLHPGGAVNIVTKSGSNSIHGNLFEFLRNGAVNARNFFAPTHDSLRRNQFGGTIGGKIIKDKLFFFGGYQGTRVRSNPPSNISFIPTTAMLGGDFSAREAGACQSNGRARSITDPANGQPFPNAQIPVSRFSPAALKLMDYLPIAAANPCGQVTYGVPGPNTEDQEIGRIDYVRSERHSLFGRYFLVDYRAPAPWDAHDLLVTTLPGNWERAQTLTIGDIYTFNATTLNSFHATASRRRDNRAPSADQINAADLGVKMFVAAPNDIRIQVANAFNIGCGTCAPGHFNVNTFQFADDLDIMRGRHQMAFGADVIRTQDNTISGYLQNGNFNFGGLGSSDPLADLLLGYLSNNGSAFAYGQSRPQPTAMRETILGLYAQDTFRVNSRFTLNLGLRWEPMLFPQDFYGRGSTFNMAAFLANQHSKVFTTAPAGMFYYGDPGVPKAFTDNKMANFAPRVGLVWNPHGDGRQTVRAGAAILYDTGMLYFSQRLMSNPPFVNEIDLNTNQTGPFHDPWQVYPGGNPFPGVTPPPSNAIFPTSAFYALLPPNLKSTYMTTWSLSYQRQIGGWLASVSYIGNKTSHLWLSTDINAPVNLPGATAANLNQRKALYLANPAQGQYFGQVPYADDGANATYNGLLLSLQHRFAHSFTALANYTWSHCIGDGDFSGDLRGVYYQNQRDRRGDRGDCNFDIRQQLNASIVALSPFKGAGWKSRLLGNWQIAPLVRMATGVPINVTSGKDNSLTGEGLDRPDVAPGVPLYMSSWGPSLQYLNPAAFTQNATGTFGNLGRDLLRYPGTIVFDVALSRVFALAERFRLEGRAEAFNVINHANFAAYSTSNFTYSGLSGAINSATFGRITSAGDPRILQFALKLHF
jgi:hypothetical protein